MQNAHKEKEEALEQEYGAKMRELDLEKAAVVVARQEANAILSSCTTPTAAEQARKSPTTRVRPQTGIHRGVRGGLGGVGGLHKLAGAGGEYAASFLQSQGRDGGGVSASLGAMESAHGAQGLQGVNGLNRRVHTQDTTSPGERERARC